MRRTLAMGLVGVAILCLGGSAFATDHYVATNGDDGWAGTEAGPWATRQYAVATIAPGETILVRAGTYLGCRISNSGPAGAVKTLAAYPGERPVVNAPGPANKQDSNIEVELYDYTTVSLTATNPLGQDTETNVDYIAVTNTSCHVGAIDVTNGGTPSYQAAATITVDDQDCVPPVGVTVDITWTGAAPGTDSDITDGNGQVTFTSDRNRDGGTFTCCVDNLTKAGYPYSSGANHETCDSITLP